MTVMSLIPPQTEIKKHAYSNNFKLFSRYAGEIFGISNTFATIPGMVAPLLVNAMTPNVSSTMCMVSSALCMYLCVGETESHSISVVDTVNYM